MLVRSNCLNNVRCCAYVQVKAGEPNCPIAFGGRGKKSIMPSDIDIQTLDHDFSLVSLVPSVTLLGLVAPGLDGPASFYKGKVLLRGWHMCCVD